MLCSKVMTSLIKILSFWPLLLVNACTTLLDKRPVNHYQHITVIGEQGEQVILLLEKYQKNKTAQVWIELFKKIDISKNNCSDDAIACSFKSKKNTIFLTPLFFSLNNHEQMGTLIHEQAHHLYGYHHPPCKNKNITNTECDNDHSSPFGQELIFYRSLDAKQKPLRQSIRKTKARLNQYWP